MPVICASEPRVELRDNVFTTAPRVLTASRALEMALLALRSRSPPRPPRRAHGPEPRRRAAAAIDEIDALDVGLDGYAEAPPVQRQYGE